MTDLDWDNLLPIRKLLAVPVETEGETIDARYVAVRRAPGYLGKIKKSTREKKHDFTVRTSHDPVSVCRGHRLARRYAALAQTASTTKQTDGNPAASDTGLEEIIVTGSRIAKAGFDQPTPTTVVGEVELREGNRPNIQQVLNDQPQFRQTVTPQVSNGNTSTGTAPVDLRGLGTSRTLTLLNGRRFVGENNLNFVPTNLVQRVEVVTGGASAAWGSGAVAGVVNIILKNDLEGISVGGRTGISSRGDGAQYGFDASFGTHFAGGNGHFMIGADYIKDEGIPIDGRNLARWFGAGDVNNGNGQGLIQRT